MSESRLDSVVTAYVAAFGQPDRTLRRSLPASGDEIRVLAYLPSEEDQEDPDGNVTQVSTAGLSLQPIFNGVACEFTVDVRGLLDDDSVEALADAFAEMSSSPRLFDNLQIRADLTLPTFRRFTTAMLIDWNATYEFRLPIEGRDVGLLRIVPLFSAEAAFVEASDDRRMAYLALVSRGLRATDPDREPVNLGSLG
ncbi:hypothetical protein AB0C07_37060 [Actinoplanes missouriensis]|uniref:hypothetical protein n=1 Tax=Actinoplanes missouriensis TaxID=1866 RepID=UPI0033F92CD2